MKLRIICKGYRHRAVIQRDILNANTLLALSAFFALQRSEPLFFRDCICDQIFLNSDLVGRLAIRALCAGFTFIALKSLFTLRPGSLHAGISRADPPVAVGTDKGGVAILAVGTVLAIDAIFTVLTVSTILTILTIPAILTGSAGSTLQAFKPLGLRSGGCKTRFLSNLVGGFSVAAILSVRSLQGCQPLRLTERTAIFLRNFIGGFSGGTVHAVSTAGGNAGISRTDPPVAIGTDIRRLPVGSGNSL